MFPSPAPHEQLAHLLDRSVSNAHHNGFAKPPPPAPDTATAVAVQEDDAMPQDSSLDHPDEYPTTMAPLGITAQALGRAQELLAQRTSRMVDTQAKQAGTIDLILQRLDGHDADLKAVDTRFEANEKRVIEMAGVEADYKGQLAQLLYRLELIEAAQRKFEKQQEEDALPLIKEIHDTSRLALDMQKEQKQLRKAIKRVEETQRSQTARVLRVTGGVLAVGVSITIIVSFITQHLVFH